MPDLCKDCVTGSIHSGDPKGKTIDVEGTDVYIATPEADYPKDKALLFLPDVFGFPDGFPNNKLLCDSFAKAGLLTYGVDYLNKDPVPADAMEKGNFDLAAWRPKHGPEQTRPGLDKAIAYARKEGVRKFAAIGYCFGAPYTFALGHEGIASVGVVCHPSRIEPEDLEKMAQIDFPILFNTCEFDQQFPPEKIELADKLMGDQARYKRNYWPGQKHGFAVRGDFSKEENRKAYDEAFRTAYEWIAKHL